MGAPVLAKDGTEVGEVSHIAFDKELQPQSLRMTTGAILGLGSRTLQVPKDAFIAVRGAIILRVAPEAVAQFPEVKPPQGK